MTVDDIAREIVAREGGFVMDPADPGGATKYGVTIGTMRALGLDVNGCDRRLNMANSYLIGYLREVISGSVVMIICIYQCLI